MKDFSITTGSIYDCMMQAEKLRKQFKEEVQEIQANRDLSDAGKEKHIAEAKERFNAKYNSLKADMLSGVAEIKNTIATTPYEYSADLEHSIDYIKTMAEAGILSDGMFKHEMDKYRGNEMSLVYAREKLKGSIPVERFDTYTFSHYSDYDMNGNRHIISPLEHFNTLEGYINGDNAIMTAHLLEQTENKLGIESVGRQKYVAEKKAQLEEAEANTPLLI